MKKVWIWNYMYHTRMGGWLFSCPEGDVPGVDIFLDRNLKMKKSIFKKNHLITMIKENLVTTYPVATIAQLQYSTHRFPVNPHAIFLLISIRWTLDITRNNFLVSTRQLVLRSPVIQIQRRQLITETSLITRPSFIHVILCTHQNLTYQPDAMKKNINKFDGTA